MVSGSFRSAAAATAPHSRTSRRDRDLHPLARGHQVLLQQMRVVLLGDSDTGMKCATICASRFLADFSGVYVSRYTAHHSAKLGIVLFQPWTPARMSCSISTARRSADFLSANPVDSRNRWPLIRFVKYQISPRFSKPIAHPLAHPAIQRLAVEPDDPTTPYERNLTTAHAVVERMSAHAQVLRGRVDVEPARLDDRSRSNVSRFHGGTPRELPRVLSGGAERLPPGAETTGIVGAALGFSGSVDGSGQGLELTSVSSLSGIGLLERRLTAARKHAVGGRVRSSAP